MKSMVFTAAFMLLLLAAQAQCSTFYYLIQGTEVEMTLYDSKGVLTGTQRWKTVEVTREGQGLRSLVQSSLIDEKGKEISKGSMRFACTGTTFKADLRMNFPQQGTPMEPVEAAVEEGFIEYPAALQEGQELRNTALTVAVKKSALGASQVAFEQRERKVIGREKIITPAGTWDAYKITYKATVSTRIGGFGIPFHFGVTEWFVPGFGVVKTETYSKKGKLVSSSLITAVKK